MKWESKTRTNIEIAKNLKGHLLLIHGDMDKNVFMAHTIRLINALMKANKRFDFVLVPGEGHGLRRYPEYRIWLLCTYFTKHLLGDYRTPVDMFTEALE